MKYCALFVLAANAAIAGESVLPDFLPPGAKVVFGAQVRRILNSSLAQGLAPEANAFGGDWRGEWQKMVGMVGFDPIKDIDEVLVAFAGEGKNPAMLLVARGNFNVDRFSANETPYLGVPVLESPKGSGVVAMLDASTVIAGERAEVQAAIGRRGAGAVTTARDAALATTVASLRERYDTWAVGDGPANLVPASARPDGLDAIDHFQFGISLSHGLELAAEVHVASAKDVEKLMATARLMQAMWKTQQPAANFQMPEIRAENRTIKLALVVPEEKLKKAIEMQRARLRPRAAGGGVTITGPAAAPAVVNEKAVPATAASGGTNVFILPGKRP